MIKKWVEIGVKKLHCFPLYLFNQLPVIRLAVFTHELRVQLCWAHVSALVLCRNACLHHQNRHWADRGSSTCPQMQQTGSHRRGFTVHGCGTVYLLKWWTFMRQPSIFSYRWFIWRRLFLSHFEEDSVTGILWLHASVPEIAPFPFF